jgi:proteic killer suppression protein
MQITYKTRKLQKALTDPAILQKTFGTNARRVAQRMAQLEAAQHLGMILAQPALECHPLKGGRTGEWALSVSGNVRLVFIVDAASPTAKNNDPMDPESVTNIHILEITDYH